MPPRATRRPGLPDLRLALRDLMADPARPVGAWWRLGGLIHAYRREQAKGQWMDVFTPLAARLAGQRRLVYVRNQLRFAERFFAQWTLAECRRLEKLGLSWRATVDLLPFRARQALLAEQGDESASQRIARALDEALRLAEAGRLDGFGVPRRLQRWRLQHRQLFGRRVGHTVSGHGRQVATALRRIDRAVDAAGRLGELSPAEVTRYRRHLAALGGLPDRLRRGTGGRVSEGASGQPRARGDILTP